MWPSLVPKRVCTTPCHLEIYQEGITEDGEPISAFSDDLKCNYQDSADTSYDAEHKVVIISGKAYFHGDIAPDLPVISGGIITVCGIERQINRGTKARNPDGSVNYTLIEVI